MQDCLALCAHEYLRPSSIHGRCKGVVWSGYTGSPQGHETSGSFCWLKNKMPRDMLWTDQQAVRVYGSEVGMLQGVDMESVEL